ncbi:12633_t:CDS:2 [Gigaspora margarita]|uniref:12633_t:CDS:1 n=1 Tax=Gigaspora margarita TaxID=4874 RepID=A0ABM8W3Q1_GIGMA|nr:12633_t:CDS:2 [Gigaspora margarita]
MNNSWCRLHKKTPYELVYENKPHSNCTLVNELYTNNIFDEEKIPDTIEISNADYKIDLDDDMTEQSPNSSVPSPNNNIGHSVSSPTSSVLSPRSIVSSPRSPVQLHDNNSSYIVLFSNS